jgi:DNA-binding phage protein
MSTVQVKTQLTFDELLRAVEQLSLPDLEQLMSQVIALQAQRKAPNLSKDETNLLLKINQGQSPEVQSRFNELADKRKAETLTLAEHQELIELTEQIEKQEAERVKHMAELARLRGISLTTLMEKLGIERPTYA